MRFLWSNEPDSTLSNETVNSWAILSLYSAISSILCRAKDLTHKWTDLVHILVDLVLVLYTYILLRVVVDMVLTYTCILLFYRVLVNLYFFASEYNICTSKSNRQSPSSLKCIALRGRLLACLTKIWQSVTALRDLTTHTNISLDSIIQKSEIIIIFLKTFDNIIMPKHVKLLMLRFIMLQLSGWRNATSITFM